MIVMIYVTDLSKHSSSVSLSSSIPPPPTTVGRSPPIHSTSSRIHPSPLLVLPAGRAPLTFLFLFLLRLLFLFLLLLSIFVDGVQNPSPVPQNPNLQIPHCFTKIKKNIGSNLLNSPTKDNQLMHRKMCVR